MEKLLTDKVAIVTGASRGIGRQIALTLAGYGATVIVNYNGSAAKAEEVVNEITANGGMAESMQCSVSDFEKSKEMIDGIVKKYGRLDILVNNAGITKDNLIMKMSEDDFDAVIATNLKGAFNCIKHVSRQMLKQRGGRIINISSVSGVMGNAGQANYSASKAGVIGLTKSNAKELGRRNITVNAIAPGFIETDMTAELNEKQIEAIKGELLIGRLGQVEDIAKLADRILVMNHGHVEMFAKTDEVFRHGARLCEIGLDVPQITRITDGLRAAGVPLREGIYTVEEAYRALLLLVT